MPAFPYERASFVLAESTIFGKKTACEKFQVLPRTFDDWKSRLKTDSKLLQMYEAHLTQLKQEWQSEAIQALKRSLQLIVDGLENHPFEERPKTIKEKETWGKNMIAMSNLIKSVGDLNISTYVLFDEE